MKLRRSRTRHAATTSSSTVPGKVLGCILVVAAMLTVTAMYVSSSGTTHLTVQFRNSAGLYQGDRVMVLGVPVGTVDRITPQSGSVRVEISVDSAQPIPADAQAAIIAPTLVSGRYVQLAPVFTGGSRLADGAVIPAERTATPVEFDEIKRQVVQLVKDVGPAADGGKGSLNGFLDQTAATVNGNGALLKTALSQLSRASVTLGNGGDDLFATVRNLSSFTSALAATDTQISAFSDQLARFSRVLADNRTEIDTLLTSLNTTFDQVKTFIETNQGALVRDVRKSTDITALLVNRIDTLAEILHATPTALSNFYNIYDPVSNSLTGALGIPDIPDPRSLICALLTTVDAPQRECSTAMSQLTANAAKAATRPGTSKSHTRGGR